MPYVDIRLTFKPQSEDEDGWIYYEPVLVQQMDTDLPDHVIESLGEEAGQSDKYQVDVSSALMLAIGTKKIIFV